MPTNSAPRGNTKHYVGITADTLRVGDKVRIIETYESGTTVTYEGKVSRISQDVAIFDIREDGGGVVVAWTEDRGNCKVQIFVVPPALPDTPGTVIKFYDVSYLRNRVATLDYSHTWRYADMPEVELQGPPPAEWVVLFDPSKDG